MTFDTVSNEIKAIEIKANNDIIKALKKFLASASLKSAEADIATAKNKISFLEGRNRVLKN